MKTKATGSHPQLKLIDLKQLRAIRGGTVMEAPRLPSEHIKIVRPTAINYGLKYILDGVEVYGYR